MKLRNLQLRHFKSLANVELNLHPQVTVLVGPNAVGKSNLVDALRFLRDAAKTSLEAAVDIREGMARIRQHGFSSDTAVELTAYLTNAAEAKGEDLNIFQAIATGSSDGNLLAFSDVDTEDQVLSHVRNWKFSVLHSETLRQLHVADEGKINLKDDASNWASVVRAAKRTTKGKHMLERVNEMMRVVLPDFQNVSISAAGSYLVPLFKFGTEEGKTRSFDPVQLSDGTLRIFGILLSLYQNPSPTLIVIEEPELTVHPGVLAMMAEAFKEVSETTQIVLTTHSPQLVEHFAPENIRVVTMSKGKTHIAPIKRAQREAVEEMLMGLGEFMAAEGLQPEPL